MERVPMEKHWVGTKIVFPIGCGGILYPPKCFHKDITNNALFTNLAPHADDIWFWAMAIINKEYFGNECPHVVIENGYKKLSAVEHPNEQKEKSLYFRYNRKGGNDRQFNAVIEQYPQIREILKKIKP